jgi:PAS domain S-box-containing protein
MLIKNRTSKQNRIFSIVEELKDGFCIINLSGEFIYANHAAQELFEMNSAENNYNFFSNFVCVENHINHIKTFLNQYDYIKDYELELFNSSSNKFPVLLTINLIKDPSKSVIGMSLLIKDMTYIKKVQQQLLQAQKMESIGMLASGVAHEFNNILTGIIPNAELIKLTTSLKDANHSRAESIQKSANRAADIVKKLLNFARTDKSEEIKVTDFLRTANETIDILRKLFDRNIELETQFSNNLYFVKIDETSLQQIIMNLSINAKDAISDKGKIRYHAENYMINANNIKRHNNLVEGKYIRFQIIDTGHGMDKEQLRYIFDPFYTTKKPGKGTGLGLSMVYGLINKVNGTIEVQSKTNSGTTFTIYLPATDPIDKKKTDKFHAKSIGKGHTVLVVDDEPMIIEMAKDMLHSLGFRVLSAGNGLEGLDIYKQKQSEISVILLDLLMPEMSGKVCYKNLKQINPKVKVVITSGIGELEKKKELEKMGITAYLEKPYSLENISKKLYQILN